MKANYLVVLLMAGFCGMISTIAHADDQLVKEYTTPPPSEDALSVQSIEPLFTKPVPAPNSSEKPVDSKS